MRSKNCGFCRSGWASVRPGGGSWDFRLQVQVVFDGTLESLLDMLVSEPIDTDPGI